ncbi:thiamine phosphate synthase [Candidatus Latescibacterota bacterium]
MKQSNSDIVRLLDANMNRAVEGIRVLEETARMLFDDSNLTISIKVLRHKLAQIFSHEKELDRSMLFARESERDVLRNGETHSERTRVDLFSLVKANAKRSQEAIRSIEEFVKLSFPGMSEKFKRIRFQLYDIEKILFLKIHKSGLVNKKRMGLYVIIENTSLPNISPKDDIFEIIRTIIGEGAGTVDLCDRISRDSAFLKNSERMIEACSGEDVTAIISDRVDIAMISGADGVKLEYDGIPANACRKITGQNFVIGSTVVKLPGPDADLNVGYDFLIACHENRESDDGTSILQQLVKQSQVPVIAICDFSSVTTKRALNCGVFGIAVKIPFPDLTKTRHKIKKIRKLI